jgi:hypothetical protein
MTNALFLVSFICDVFLAAGFLERQAKTSWHAAVHVTRFNTTAGPEVRVPSESPFMTKHCKRN